MSCLSTAGARSSSGDRRTRTSSWRTGVLGLRRAGHEAELQVENGRLLRCSVDGRADFPAAKTLVRVLAWSEGTFERRRVTPGSAPAGSILGPLEPLLLEATRQLDELRPLLPRLPARFAAGAAPGGDLDGWDRALLAVAIQLGSLERALDATPLSDLNAALRVETLLARGLLVPLAPKG